MEGLTLWGWEQGEEGYTKGDTQMHEGEKKKIDEHLTNIKQKEGRSSTQLNSMIWE